jgi:hypothetical protein
MAKYHNKVLPYWEYQYNFAYMKTACCGRIYLLGEACEDKVDSIGNIA